jgi:hypothetical protein
MHVGMWHPRPRVPSTVLFITFTLLAGCSSPAAAAPARSVEVVQAREASAPIAKPALRIDRGPGTEPIVIPRDESLTYQVAIDLGILGDLRVGSVVLSAGEMDSVAPDGVSAGPAGWIRSEATGSYLSYKLEEVLDVRYRTQEWPALLYTDIQTGSENRRHELRLGVRDGRPTFQFDEDHHCPGCSNPEHKVESIWPWGKPYHCDGCKRMQHRVWDVSIQKPAPAGTVDLLSAVYLARSMVAEGRSTETFPVLDQDKLWILTLRTGARRAIATDAGKFDCALVELETGVPPGEVRKPKDFSGLFGIQGNIGIWMDAAAGVPVQITGDLPVPVIGRLSVNARLSSYRGTPPEFEPSR